MRLNYLGIIGGLLAFISLALPWWFMNISSSSMGMGFSGLYLYLYQATATMMGVSVAVSINPWFSSTAMVSIVIAGLLCFVNSVMANYRRMALALGGILTLFSIIVFATGLQYQISNGALAMGYPTGAGLFSSGSYGYLGASFNYSSYLFFGFWLALVAAIIMFAAITREPVETPWRNLNGTPKQFQNKPT